MSSMRLPMRLARRTMALTVRVLLGIVAIAGITTIILQMYLLNEKYVTELSVKNLQIQGSFDSATDERNYPDNNVNINAVPADFQWKTETTIKVPEVRKWLHEFEEETRTDDYEDYKLANMTTPPDDQINAWFAATGTTKDPALDESITLPTIKPSQSRDSDGDVTEKDYARSATQDRQGLMAMIENMALEEKQIDDDHEDDNVDDTKDSVPATEPPDTDNDYSHDEEILTSPMPVSSKHVTQKQFSEMHVTFGATEPPAEVDDTVDESNTEKETSVSDWADESQQPILSSSNSESDDSTAELYEWSDGSETNIAPMVAPNEDAQSRPDYILPVFRGIGQGPNNQYLAFKAIVLYALIHKKTIVLPPFFNHHRITEDDVRTFNETFNVNLLKSFVPIASLEQFKKDCNSRVDAVLYTKPCISSKNCYFDSLYRTMIPVFEILAGVQFPTKVESHRRRVMPIIMLPDKPPMFSQNSISDYLLATKDVFRTDTKCTAMFYPFPFMKLMMNAHQNNIFEMVESHLSRAMYIRKMADLVIRSVLQNMRYLAVHWRLNYEFKIVWCGRRLECRWGCQYIYKRNSSEEIVRTFEGLMEAFNLSAIYFAAPQMQNHKIWDNIKGRIPNAFNSTDVINNLANLYVPEMKKPLKDDNYILSLIEQEICYRSSLFVGTAISSWTYMVEQDRLGKGTVLMPDIFGDPVSYGKCR
ncbi:uncharacterized protein LOC100368304 [Saccoglossus kowalevskii]|uniref:GDP-fucose protein O-fucosyltransferase 2 n=1 Tax=Saccoglossus kowalevskii TaxID=10224 RepID=A0ABM0GZG8_SACKO|nr:PREDICTED: uncharacterized protein LOC100368304 [Saccoglossus kowalevskii]